jgi:hypothetical protein
MSMPLKIYTIGHGALTFEEFLRRLQAHGIAALADVRRFPTSKRHPHICSNRGLRCGISTRKESCWHTPLQYRRRRSKFHFERFAGLKS